jgi:hypothetical protein
MNEEIHGSTLMSQQWAEIAKNGIDKGNFAPTRTSQLF